MWENKVNLNSNKAQEDSEMDQDQGRVLCGIWNNSNMPRNIWSELKEQKVKTKCSVLLEYKWSERRKIKMQYDRKNKENQSNNKIKATNKTKKTKWKKEKF